MQKVLFVRLDDGTQSKIVDKIVQQLGSSYINEGVGYSFELVTFSPKESKIVLKNELVIVDVQLKYLVKEWKKRFPSAYIETIDYRGYGLIDATIIFEQILSMQEKL